VLHQPVGRPTEVVQGDPDRPIRIVVESISSRRREASADVEVGEDEVESCRQAASQLRTYS
jgi:hypothetical protein